MTITTFKVHDFFLGDFTLALFDAFPDEDTTVTDIDDMVRYQRVCHATPAELEAFDRCHPNEKWERDIFALGKPLPQRMRCYRRIATIGPDHEQFEFIPGDSDQWQYGMPGLRFLVRVE